jgi:hypothetical protein
VGVGTQGVVAMATCATPTTELDGLERVSTKEVSKSRKGAEMIQHTHSWTDK